MPGTMQNAGEALGSKASMTSPQGQTNWESESTLARGDPKLLQGSQYPTMEAPASQTLLY